MPQTDEQLEFHRFRASLRFRQYQDLAAENGYELDWRHEPGEEGGNLYLRVQGDPDWAMLENSREAIREELAEWGVDLDNLSAILERRVPGGEWCASAVDRIEQDTLALAMGENLSEWEWESRCAAATGKEYN